MLKYRKLTDLTDEEIKFAINDIIHPESIGEIVRDGEYDTIDIDVTTDWGEDGEALLVEDTLTLEHNTIRTPWYSHDNEDFRWKQFLLAKGCNRLLKDNPYLEG